jgi:ATP-binding cassette subfamily B (MDR/TAP) protein 1
MLNLIATITTAIILSCIIGWKLALVCASTIPILLLCGFLRFWVLSRFEARAGKAYLKSATIACEAVSAVSTIASLTREEDVWNSYHGRLKEQLSKSIRSILKTSLLYAAAQSFALLCMGLGFWYGGRLILAREYSMFQFFVCFSSVIFSAQSAGALFSFAPDMAKSRQAAQQLKNLCDRVPAIDSWAQGGDKIQNIEGKIEFRNVYFSYPSSGVQVLQGLNICVQPGQLIALVGASGCGKSTAIGLIERFYSPTSGGIFFDGKNIMELNVKEYRSHLALVSQDSVLYSGTVRENVLLGVEAGNVEDEKVVEACQKAGIYDFIVSICSIPSLLPSLTRADVTAERHEHSRRLQGYDALRRPEANGSSGTSHYPQSKNSASR